MNYELADKNDETTVEHVEVNTPTFYKLCKGDKIFLSKLKITIFFFCNYIK